MTQLSILIPSIPSRFERAKSLYQKIASLVGERDIEILMLTDNKKRTIGEKREALKNASNGKYFMFVDDDDDLLDIEDLYNATFQDVDVITFKQLCLNSDKTTFTVTFGLGNEIEHNEFRGRYSDCKRPPFHICAWNQRFRDYAYPPVNYSEDWGWLQQVLPLAKTEKHIPKIVHSYNFDPKISEASTESNMIWQNPNINSSIVLPKMNKKRAVVSLGTESNNFDRRRNYKLGRLRLEKSLIENCEQDFFVYKSEDEVNAPNHLENSHAFKIFCFKKLLEMGYEQIIWLDCSFFLIKNINEIFDNIDEDGYIFVDSGWLVGTWTNDKTLDYFNINRDESMLMKMVETGLIGLDFTNKKTQDFFNLWEKSMQNGMFNGYNHNDLKSESQDIRCRGHRHDQSCASIIFNQLNFKKLEGNKFFKRINYEDEIPDNDKICLYLDGIA
jgi:hypothetical protein